MHLFETASFRGVTLKNRIVVSPMCQYCAEDGHPTSWHLVHLGSRAVGSAALVFTEATAVLPEGRISPEDTGIWSDAHAESWRPIAKFIRDQGAVAGMQLAHAGRKASTASPWNGGKELTPEAGGWAKVLAPSALRYNDSYPMPSAMTTAQIDEVVEAFGAAAARAHAAGFEVFEIHAAHGYLLHEFLSPLSNERTDEYGGSLENRLRFLQRVIGSVRSKVPELTPVFVRISATDWVEGGWDLESSVALAEAIKGPVDLIDVSSGALSPKQKIPIGPGYQTPFAAEIRRRTGLATGAVGLITSPEQAAHIVTTEQADLVILARELLRDPYWPRRAAVALGAKIEAPKQYGRAW